MLLKRIIVFYDYFFKFLISFLVIEGRGVRYVIIWIIESFCHWQFKDILAVELWMKRDALIKDDVESISFCITSCSNIYHAPSFLHV